MSTAQINSVSLAHPRTERFGSRWERLLAVASICLPIPLLAATGLSIPLPGSVERVGAALVAWVDAAAEVSPLPETGAIVLADETDAAPEARDEVLVAVKAAASQTAATQETAAGGDSRGGGGKGGSDGSESGGSGGAGSGGSTPPTGSAGGSGGSNEPGLVEGTVGEVTKTTEPVLDLVDDTLGGVGETVDGLLPTDDLLGEEGLLGGGGLLGSGK